MEFNWNTGTDENPLDSNGRPFHRLPSMAEYQMAKKFADDKEYQEFIDTCNAIKELKKNVAG